MKSSDPKVAIVIPTILSKLDLIRDCIIRALSFAQEPIQLIVQSRGGSFAHQCNQGAKACSSTIDYILFLNDDVLIKSTYLQNLRNTSLFYDAAIVGAKLLYPNNRIQHAGVYFRKNTYYPYHVHLNTPESALTYPLVKGLVPAVTGAVMFIKKSIFDLLGGFDENFVNGFEDIDLCLRCLDLGYSIALDVESDIIHYEKQSRGSIDKQIRQNLEYLREKWPPEKIHSLLERHQLEYTLQNPVPRQSSPYSARIRNKPSNRTIITRPINTKEISNDTNNKMSSDNNKKITSKLDQTLSHNDHNNNGEKNNKNLSYVVTSIDGVKAVIDMNENQWPYNPNCNEEVKYKILIHVPIGIGDFDCIRTIHDMDYGHHLVDVLFTYGNPLDPKYDKTTGKESDISILYTNLEYKFIKAIEYAKRNQIDYILNIEHDMICQRDSLLQILKYANPKGLVSGLYRCRPSKNPRSPLAFTIPHPQKPNKALFIEKDQIKSPIICNLRNICYGFLLIGRDVFVNHPINGCDGKFSSYCYVNKIPMAIATRVIIGHKDRDGRILWP